MNMKCLMKMNKRRQEMSNKTTQIKQGMNYVRL